MVGAFPTIKGRPISESGKREYSTKDDIEATLFTVGVFLAAVLAALFDTAGNLQKEPRCVN